MGQRASREKPHVEFNGVRMTRALGTRLGLTPSSTGMVIMDHESDGVSQMTPSSSTNPDIRAAAALSSRVDHDVKVATEKIIAKSKVLSKALETSKHVNDLLLAREEEEMEKIDALSREILEKEAEKYHLNVEAKESVPCGEFERRVLQCYAKHEDTLQCKSVVDEYASCSRQCVAVAQ